MRLAFKTLFPVAFVSTACVTVIGVILSPWPFMGDFPGHVAMMDVASRYNDPQTLYRSIFIIPHAFTCNSLTVSLAGWLSPFLDAHLLARLLLISYLLGVPYGSWLLCQRWGRSPWLAFGAFPLSYGSLYGIGLLNYLVATPLVLFCIARADAIAKQNDRKDIFYLATLLVICAWTHIMAYLFAGAFCAFVMLAQTRAPRRILNALWALLPSLLFVAPWFYRMFIAKYATAEGRHLVTESQALYFASPKERMRDLYGFGPQLFLDYADEIMSALLLLLTVALGIYAFRERRSRAMNTWLPLALTAFALMLYFVLPTHAGEVQIISSRALHWATLFGIIIPPLGPTLERAAMGRGALLTASFLVALGYSTLIAVRSADYTKHVVGSLPTAVARLPNKSRLVWMNLDFSNPITHQGALWHLGVGLHMLHNGGLVSDSFARTPHHAVQYRAHKIPPSFNIDEIAAEGSHDYDFMLLNGASIPAHWKGTHCLNLRFRQFRWWLFEVKRPPCSAQP